MDRVNGTDWVDIGGGRRGFRSQNAAAGIPGTEVTDTILNDMQEEICAVIENAGFALDPQNQQQLWEALQSIAAPGFANRAGWLPVISITMINPPNDATVGDAYIIPAGATGAWAGNQQKYTEWTGSSWRIVTTKDGHGVSLPDGRVFEKIAGTYIEKPALDVQSGRWAYAVAGGTANALTATLAPAPSSYAAGMVLAIKVSNNNTGAATININGLGVKPIVRGDGSQLQKDDLVAGQIASLMYDGTAWQVDGLKSSQVPPRNMTTYSIAGTYSFVVPSGVYKIYGICIGGGGGAAGMGVLGDGSPVASGGGGAGGTVEGWFDVSPGQVIPIIVGAKGIGGAAAQSLGTFGIDGGTGGTSSIGTFATATGGEGGRCAPSAGGGGGSGVGGQIVKVGGMAGDGGGSVGTFFYAGMGGASSAGGGGRAALNYVETVCDGKAAGSGGGAIYGSYSPDWRGGSGATGMVIIQY